MNLYNKIICALLIVILIYLVGITQGFISTKSRGTITHMQYGCILF